jgi:hypothetical protein
MEIKNSIKGRGLGKDKLHLQWSSGRVRRRTGEREHSRKSGQSVSEPLIRITVDSRKSTLDATFESAARVAGGRGCRVTFIVQSNIVASISLARLVLISGLFEEPCAYGTNSPRVHVEIEVRGDPGCAREQLERSRTGNESCGLRLQRPERLHAAREKTPQQAIDTERAPQVIRDCVLRRPTASPEPENGRRREPLEQIIVYLWHGKGPREEIGSSREIRLSGNRCFKWLGLYPEEIRQGGQDVRKDGQIHIDWHRATMLSAVQRGKTERGARNEQDMSETEAFERLDIDGCRLDVGCTRALEGRKEVY